MSSDKRSTMQYSPVTASARTILGLPRRIDAAKHTRAHLSVWEGEGGAIEAPAAAVRSLAEPAEPLACEPQSDDAIDALATELRRVTTVEHVQRNESNAPKPGILQVPATRQNARRNPTSRPRVRRTMGRGSR
jgi:hypothetical protein